MSQNFRELGFLVLCAILVAVFWSAALYWISWFNPIAIGVIVLAHGARCRVPMTISSLFMATRPHHELVSRVFPPRSPIIVTYGVRVGRGSRGHDDLGRGWGNCRFRRSGTYVA